MKALTRGKITGSILLTAVLAFSMPLTVCAETYDIANGSVAVSSSSSGQQVRQGSTTNIDESPVITGTTNDNRVVISSYDGTTANVTISDLNITYSPTNLTPITIIGHGDVVIELDGESSLIAGDGHAAIETRNADNLIIQDSNQIAGKLNATGGCNGAGIGGGANATGRDITITGGTIIAYGGNGGAGIGGGREHDGKNITISGGTVIATGGDLGSGIGGGYGGYGDEITISGEATVTATGGGSGAGIGGGAMKSGSKITISGEATVTATGGNGGAGIGGGFRGAESEITISGGTVKAIGGAGGAGIGCGASKSEADSIIILNDAKVSAAGGGSDNTYGAGAALGVGGQDDGSGGNYIIPNTIGLFETGFVSIYPAGTLASAINPAIPGGTTTVGTIPDPNASLTSSTTTTPSTPVATGRTSTSLPASSGNSVNDSEPSSIDFALFLESIDKQIEDNLKRLNELLSTGKTEELQALRTAGIRLDTGDWISFRKSTYALIEQASNAGIPVTIDFIYQGQRYSTTIPAYAKVSPVSLCNEEGYCGFLNLIKHYGGVER